MVKALLLMAVGMTLQVQWDYNAPVDNFKIYHWVAGKEPVQFVRYSTVSGADRSKVFSGLSSNRKNFFAIAAVSSKPSCDMRGGCASYPETADGHRWELCTTYIDCTSYSESSLSNIIRTGVPSAIVRGKVTGNVQ